jgi:hypothetical protein
MPVFTDFSSQSTATVVCCFCRLFCFLLLSLLGINASRCSNNDRRDRHSRTCGCSHGHSCVSRIFASCLPLAQCKLTSSMVFLLIVLYFWGETGPKATPSHSSSRGATARARHPFVLFCWIILVFMLASKYRYDMVLGRCLSL